MVEQYLIYIDHLYILSNVFRFPSQILNPDPSPAGPVSLVSLALNLSEDMKTVLVFK